jgi:hypothetical protein
VGCISPRDYGNMLVFVNRGALAATNKLRGRVIGTAATMIMQIVGPLMDLDVKAWRNAAFEACKRKVPDPDSQFLCLEALRLPLRANRRDQNTNHLCVPP